MTMGQEMFLMGFGGMTLLPAMVLAIIASITTLISVAVKGLTSQKHIDVKRTSGDEVP